MIEEDHMESWINESGLQWRPMAPFGIEIAANLASLSPAASAHFVTLFNRHGLILARGQTITLEQQAALMGLIGPVIRRVDGMGYSTAERGDAAARAELSFHADYAFSDHPLVALSLYGYDLVDGASSTSFASAELAWQRLPVPLRERLAASQAEMISPQYGSVTLRACEQRLPDAMLRNLRPAMLMNPRSGRPCIGVNEMHTARLLGMDWAESRDVLNAVYDCLYAPDNVYTHLWRRRDIVIWDNIGLHHARGSLTNAGRRVLQRVTCGSKGLWEMYPSLFPEAERYYVPAVAA
jgi:taurine dioxygenase